MRAAWRGKDLVLVVLEACVGAAMGTSMAAESPTGDKAWLGLMVQSSRREATEPVLKGMDEVRKVDERKGKWQLRSSGALSVACTLPVAKCTAGGIRSWQRGCDWAVVQRAEMEQQAWLVSIQFCAFYYY